MICMTPLYHFTSDVDELVLADGIRIVNLMEYAGPSFDEEVGKYLQVYEPPYVLFHNPGLSPDLFLGDLPRSGFHPRIPPAGQIGVMNIDVDLYNHFLYGTAKLLTLLRLFKPGRVHAGETFILDDKSSTDEWPTMSSGRASSMVIDYHRLADKTTSYVLNSVELTFFCEFMNRMTPFMLKLGEFPVLDTGLQIYGAEDGLYLDAVNVMTALESLVTKQDEVEGLTYRLALRTANLLGRDVGERRNIFRGVKDFYYLRSRIVHGAELNERMIRRFDELQTMHELLRRALLSVMGLISSGTPIGEIPNLIDELAFDDRRRRDVQQVASAFLYM
jgi:hypothetical protein